MLKKFHPIVISEIYSFSARNSGRNFSKVTPLKKFYLENFGKNKNIAPEKNYPPLLSVEAGNGRLRFDEEGPLTLRSIIEYYWFCTSIYDKKYLLNNFSDIINIGSDRKCTLLILASLKGKLEIIKILLKEVDIDVNLQDNCGQTALILAVRNDYLEIVKMLLARDDINVDLKDIMNRTALDRAVLGEKSKMIELLQ